MVSQTKKQPKVKEQQEQQRLIVITTRQNQLERLRPRHRIDTQAYGIEMTREERAIAREQRWLERQIAKTENESWVRRSTRKRRRLSSEEEEISEESEKSWEFACICGIRGHNLVILVLR